MKAIKGFAVAALMMVMTAPAYVATDISADSISGNIVVAETKATESDSFTSVLPGDNEKQLSYIRRHRSDDD